MAPWELRGCDGRLIYCSARLRASKVNDQHRLAIIMTIIIISFAYKIKCKLKWATFFTIIKPMLAGRQNVDIHKIL